MAPPNNISSTQSASLWAGLFHRLLPRSWWTRGLLLLVGIPLAWWLVSWTVCGVRSRQRIERPQPVVSGEHPPVPSGQVPDTAQQMAIMDNPQAWLFDRINAARSVLEFSTEADAITALRSLGSMSGYAAANVLGAVAQDETWQKELRIEAIHALRTMNTSDSGNVLKQVLDTVHDLDLQEQVVAALGNQPWESVQPQFAQLLQAPDSPSSLRVAVAEAMGYSTEGALPVLHQLVAGDKDADVRAAAAWAMSIMRTEQEHGKELARLLKQEPETMVRRRMYEALLVQKDNAALEVTPVIERETDVPARVAALNALGDAVSRSMDAKLADSFDTQWVQELRDLALNADTENLRLRSVFALRRAGTPGAMEALAFIRDNATPRTVAVAAAHATSFSR